MVKFKRIFLENYMKIFNLKNFRNENEMLSFCLQFWRNLFQKYQNYHILQLMQRERAKVFSRFNLKTQTMEYENVVFCGDFNSNILLEASLTNYMLSMHHNSTSTTLIDLIFVMNYLKTLLYDQVSAPCFTRHDLLFLTYDFKSQLSEQIYSFRDFKNMDSNLLHERLSQITWNLYCIPSADTRLFQSDLKILLGRNLGLLTEGFCLFKDT